MDATQPKQADYCRWGGWGNFAGCKNLHDGRDEYCPRHRAQANANGERNRARANARYEQRVGQAQAWREEQRRQQVAAAAVIFLALEHGLKWADGTAQDLYAEALAAAKALLPR